MFLMDAFSVGGRNNSLQGIDIGDAPPGQLPEEDKSREGAYFDQFFAS